MSDAGWTAIAALGATALTAGSSWVLLWWQEQHKAKADERAQYESLVTTLLSRSMGMMFRCQAISATLQIRSSLAEGVDVLIGIRKPLDPMEYHDWIMQDWNEMNKAWSAVWITGDQALILDTNNLMARVGDVIEAYASLMTPKSVKKKATRLVVGERATADMLEAQDRALTNLASARKNLADHARNYLGSGKVELFVPEQES